MKRSMLVIAASAAGVIALPGVVSAQQVIEHTDGFVCPVFNADTPVGDKNKNAFEIGGGDFSIRGGDVSVPKHATNGDGTGSPGGTHSSTGDTDYTAVWAGAGD